MKVLMTIDDVAEYLGVSKDTMYKYADEGKVPGFKLGNRWRFRLADVEKWIEQQVEKGQ